MAVVTAMLYNQRRPIIAKLMSMVSSESSTSSPASDSKRTRVYRAKVPSASTKTAQKPPAAARRTETQPKKMASGSEDKKFQASNLSSRRRSSGGTSPSQTATGTRKPNPARFSKVKKPLKQDIPPPGSAPAGPPAPKTTASEDTRPTAPAASAKQTAKTRPRKAYDRIADSKLKLQALAWSDDAVRRMAVINGRIVHEGESVDGYQVLEIREEDVIVNAAGKSWRLEFGLQQ
jgi:hypothetical protein